MIIFSGLDHKSPLEEREALTLTLSNNPDPGSVRVITCDRVEVYSGSGPADAESAEHLFRLVAGLESPLIGENQIQGQVKRAYADASREGGLSADLHRLFQTALRVGKRVRSETGIGKGAQGHAQMVIQMLRDFESPLETLKVMVIGVNKLNQAILRYLVSKGNRDFLLVNRTLEKAAKLVNELEAGRPIDLESVYQELPEIDVVISATSAPGIILPASAIPARPAPRWVFDLAVPRDIDPAVAALPGIALFNVSDLEELGRRNRKLRQEALEEADAIINEEVIKYLEQAEKRQNRRHQHENDRARGFQPHIATTPWLSRAEGL